MPIVGSGEGRNVSTTLVPPTHYEVRQQGRQPRLFKSITDVAAELLHRQSEPKTVFALTAGRRRHLIQWELQELGRELRLQRLQLVGVGGGEPSSGGAGSRRHDRLDG